MAFSRYRKRNKIANNSEELRDFLENKEISYVNHYTSPNNTIDKSKQNFSYFTYTWKSGDFLYKLSHKFLGDPKFWWVIAKINKKPTDHDYEPGDEIIIPNKNVLNDVIEYLGY